MIKKKIRYTIRATQNYGIRRSIGFYKKKSDARKELNRILSKPKKGKTAYRNVLSGIGINNPRILKIRSYA